MMTFSYNSARLREGQARFGDGGRRQQFKNKREKTNVLCLFRFYCKMFIMSFNQLDTHIDILVGIRNGLFTFRILSEKPKKNCTNPNEYMLYNGNIQYSTIETI